MLGRSRAFRSTLFVPALALAALFIAELSWAGAPEVVRFQGTVSSLGGAPVEDGLYDVRAELYDGADSGASLLYSQTLSVPIQGGAYTVVLSPEAGSSGELISAFETDSVFVEITVLSDPGGAINETLLPRQEVASVPYALTSTSTSESDTFQGALVVRTSDQTIPNKTETSIAWQQEIYDEGNWSDVSDSATNVARLTVLDGVSRVRVTCQVDWEWNESSFRVLRIKMNGSTFPGQGHQTVPVPADGRIVHSATSAVVVVQPGDFFECRVKQSTGGGLLVQGSDSTWFSIEAVK